MLLKNVHFETLGCKLNQVESEGAARAFTDSGFFVSMEPLTAAAEEDQSVIACVVNTCTVTAKAEQKARRIIRLLLNKCPNSTVIVTGCYAQLDPKDLLAMDSRVAVLGGQNKGLLADVPDLINKNPDLYGVNLQKMIQSFFDEKTAGSLPDVINQPFRLSTDTFINHSRSSIKIQDGCNCQCTYCRIRLARGKSVSLDVKSVLDRIRALEESGQQEVVITTVNIGQYRGLVDLDENYPSLNPESVKTGPEGKVYTDFPGLLQLILDSTKSIGVRISSLYPEIVDQRLGAILVNPRVRPHFHISVQSGSDSVLFRMKRPYKIQAVYNAVKILKEAKGNPFLACDIIAGFPGESDQDFQLTMKMLRECGFTFVHAFPFSARPGTEAYSMRPMVPNNITDKRISALEDFNNLSKTEYINSFKGKILPAVCETVHRARASLMKDRIIVHAVTENFLHCQLVFPLGDLNIPKAGSLVNVEITGPLDKSQRTGESDTMARLV